MTISIHKMASIWPILYENTHDFLLTDDIHPAIRSIEIKDLCYKNFILQFIFQEILIFFVNEIEGIWLRELKFLNLRKEIKLYYKIFIK